MAVAIVARGILTIGWSNRGAAASVSQGEVDDLDKSALLVDNATPRRSTSSLDTEMAVAAPFEDVLEVSEYFDGPRAGVAFYLGRPHKFRSLWRDVYGPDETADVFELTPLDTETPAPVRMRGKFEVAANAPVVAPGQLRKLVVSWIPYVRVSV